MPVLKRQSGREAIIQEGVALWHDLEDQSQWRRNGNGNLVRDWNVVTKLTIYFRYGKWWWCIAAPGAEPQFSESGYSSKAQAIEALGNVLLDDYRV